MQQWGLGWPRLGWQPTQGWWAPHEFRTQDLPYVQLAGDAGDTLT
jgi:hypothetical protein